MFQRHQQLRSIKPRPRLVKLALPLQVMEQLSTVHEGEYEVQLFSRLEGEFEGDNEWTIDFGEYSSFGQGMGDFRARDDMGFPNSLECVDSECVAFTYLHDLIVSFVLGDGLAFPNDPFPMTLSSSNESIVRGVCCQLVPSSREN
jgi:hypothetical protein